MNSDVPHIDHPDYRQLIDSLGTAVLVVDINLCLTFINPAAEALLQVGAARVLGANITQLLPLGDNAEEELHRAIAEFSSYTNRSHVLTRPGGPEITVDLTVSPHEGAHRVARGLIFEMQTIDRIKRISREENQVSSQETTQALVRGLAHEIKNPLGGLRGAAQLLAMELNDPGLEEYTNIIIGESDRLRALVDRMLGPHQQARKLPLNVHEVLEHVRNLVLAEVGQTARLICDYDPSVPDVLADRNQLIQAVLNIVRNGLQATEANEGERTLILKTRVQRQFTIGTRIHRLVCRIDITDNGPGIEPDLFHAIFFPMVSGRADGTGLGLAISQSIINQHKGLIECDSEPGRTEFTLYIPLDT